MDAYASLYPSQVERMDGLNTTQREDVLENSISKFRNTNELLKTELGSFYILGTIYGNAVYYVALATGIVTYYSKLTDCYSALNKGNKYGTHYYRGVKVHSEHGFFSPEFFLQYFPDCNLSPGESFTIPTQVAKQLSIEYQSFAQAARAKNASMKYRKPGKPAKKAIIQHRKVRTVS